MPEIVNNQTDSFTEEYQEIVNDFAEKNGVSYECALNAFLEIGLRESRRLRNSDDPDLSKRQLAVLECLRAGAAVKEIAGQLNISEATVRTHIHRIRGRLDCADLLSLRMPSI